ncbi:MAG: phage antirepressor KilAC domain-containing protein [Lacticaseibacillus paracasei]|uniref:phage antirepressor n=1 Tax=Lacticaseibacillus paracasei TaxID=1597 RepID=UPI0015F9BB28|nr:phage antirepressor KilAC domain-containing protein [Lacticaseibacillus paracasei]MBB1167246.1 phage repressor protein/antirepressor Ant [Lacticaseibacillus paracasei]MDN6006911.1 phage antirepressor KilAC domain-containing protein [Lacticaseibacillus paracasei]MDN6091306.1 phage antirepressor KilAC domain-containing protein [Lacticaseibacillus paracasei]MDN6223323.1 phage antirepressor KilAC domain-containing protein [Lacticaseibacillus paracasei]MDN6447662.1 phage antirepressor KilAC doma
MNELQEFNFQGNQLRTVLIDSEPFFVGKDAATAIGYKNFRDALKTHVKAKYKRESRITTPFGTQTMTVISEPGLYQLAGESKLPSADPFQDWVYEQVLPSIRKHGAYMTPETIEKAIYNPDFIINLATQLKDEQAKTAALTADNETMKPKALFADAVATSHTTILVGDLAKVIKQNGVDIGAKRLFAWLREQGYLIKRIGADYNSPTQRAMELGLFEVKETAISHSDGHVTVQKTPKVTGKGQQYFINKFLQKEAV